MEVTKKAEYAIRALLELANNPDQYISSKKIASQQNIPVNFLPQIIAILGNKGWVEGVRGPGGGVKLIENPKNITILNVIELIEGPVGIANCLAREGSCNNVETCPLHPIWVKAQTAMVQVLDETTLADAVGIGEIIKQRAN